MNIKEQNITKVQHMKSFLGLFKTLQMAKLGVSCGLAPLKEAVARKNSNDKINWDVPLSQCFREPKSHIKHVHTIYLPHLDNQLVIKIDAASHVPGIVCTVYDVKEGNLVPVMFHSSRLKSQSQNWQPYEIEGLSIVTDIQTGYNLLRVQTYNSCPC